MKREDLFRALANSESFTERALLFVIGLPAPFTFIVSVGALVGAFVAGMML